MERLGERGRYDRESGMLAGHRRPFLIHSFLDVPAHERAHPGLRGSGEARTEEYDGAQ